MSQCTQLLNPPKTFDTKILPIKTLPSTRTNLKFKKFSTISAPVMRSQNQTQGQQQLSLVDALLNSNRKEEALAAIRSSLSNRLSETNLQLTVPGLKSKTRGKVNYISTNKLS
ncbi:hypothetical protein L6164_030637 [Bauhinia variegata]|uniref:Uncharacterized protein n=1 Tax=Bauhinia variegata TaxID=167791 RepID=A0ACB9LCF1_BAUVA|nr:hypothetical protein L6164_030637 [Bauhinia variegata]